ncbi:hypothetical protein AK830_g11505 [Neonectria ditissima]|uniref:Potassium channel domain-containing protein n=1 Tax=Neonectria ditissima TaxID=78410 RepID=A0A0N8H535_9HYPO|nr:hypothetical protein AK830_g11505 [Neonectria ditissima]
MDDGDLGDVIQDDAEIVESCDAREKKFSNDDAHLKPTTVPSSATGAGASAFSICALVRPWRQQLPTGVDVKDAIYIPDPPWSIAVNAAKSRLTIVNAIQLVVAIISNVCLLLNMARRVRFSIAQPVTIIGWYISAICLLSLNATAAGPLLQGIDFPDSELIWSQAFYYGIWAAILYFLDASFMVVTFYGASTGHYDKDFMLTSSQRTLMLQTIMFLMYLLLGALIFSNIEDWTYLDAVYWADVTLFTVGFGDYSAQTTLGRALMMPYALVGVISLGLVIGSIRSLVLERGRRRVDARMEEKRRRRVVRSMTRRGEDDLLEPIRSDSGLSQPVRSEKVPTTEFERRKAEFELMRKIQNQTSSRRRWVAMGISTGTWLVLWLLGAFIFVKCEQPYQDWTYFDGFYFCFVTLTTIGYGDVTPVSNAGKSFFVFWSLLALPTMTVLISNAGDTVVKFVRDSTLRLGNITILPGEENFINDVRYIVQKLTCGKLLAGTADIPKSMRPGSGNKKQDPFTEPMTKSEVESTPQEDDEARGRDFDIEHEAARNSLSRPRRTASTFTARVRRSLSRLRDPQEELPTGTDFHFLLVSEIQVVTGHLKQSKPYRYSFDQWAWYLKLIGEDERKAETHRKAKPKQKHGDHKDDHTNHSPTDKSHTAHSQCDDELEAGTWSWVGNRSPLMGSQEESEWILDRLTDTLRESLSAERRRQLRVPLKGGDLYHNQPHHHHEPSRVNPDQETDEEE